MGAERNVQSTRVPRLEAATVLRQLLTRGPFPVFYWRAPHQRDFFIAAGIVHRGRSPRRRAALPAVSAAARPFAPMPLLYVLPFDAFRDTATSRFWVPEYFYHPQRDDAELLSCVSGKDREHFLRMLDGVHRSARAVPRQEGGRTTGTYTEPRAGHGHVGNDDAETSDVNAPLHDASTSDDRYRDEVRAGLEAIHEGALQKIVLARRRTVQAAMEWDAALIWERLNAAHPDCYSLLYAASAGEVFVSATPERLARVKAGSFSSEAVAGTLPLGGEDDEPQGDFAEGKLLDEHGQVVQMIRAAAARFCDDVRSGEAEIRKYRGYAHLGTSVTGTLRPGENMLSAVAALHPTPAVAGQPREEAMLRIPGIEGFDRGLYAGVAGWMTPDGDGEAAVTIRSITLRGRTATMYAGAGIVRDSDVDVENEETLLKLRPLLDALHVRA